LYRGKWSNIESYVNTNYPNWIIYHHVTLQEELTELFKKGHLEYAVRLGNKRPSRERTCEGGICNLKN